MKRALITLKVAPHYRREAFEAGAKACGFTLVRRLDDPKPGDLLIVWNLCGGTEKLADTFKARGGQVIVTENAYIALPGRQMYAVSLGRHNGAGTFPVGDSSRWQALGITPKPWRKDGDHLLVCAQRGIGDRQMASPHMWHQKAVERLKRWTKRPIRVRPHPGNRSSTAVPLEKDLKGAWACVIWGSAAGVRALVDGVPVFYDAPKWICSEAALPLRDWIENPLCNDAWREKSLNRLAWGQWHPDEIATGEPLRRILNDPHREV